MAIQYGYTDIYLDYSIYAQKVKHAQKEREKPELRDATPSSLPIGETEDVTLLPANVGGLGFRGFPKLGVPLKGFAGVV